MASLIEEVRMALRDRCPAGRQREGGAAAVEFALVLPLLMMLLLGTIDWGFYFWQVQVCTNAAREGARVGSLYRPTDLDFSVAQSEAENAVSNYITNGLLDVSKLNPTPADVVITNTDATVTVAYDVSALTGFTGYVFPDTIRAVAVMRRTPLPSP